MPVGQNPAAKEPERCRFVKNLETQLNFDYKVGHPAYQTLVHNVQYNLHVLPIEDHISPYLNINTKILLIVLIIRWDILYIKR